MKKLFFCFLITTIGCTLMAQTYQPNWASLNTRKMPAWFHQDKFGIFIHWGLYAVPSYAPVIPNSGYSYSEWYWRRIRLDNKEPRPDDDEKLRAKFTTFHNKLYGSNFTYEQFEPKFKAEMFDPAQWAEIFKQSGARYVVLTSKHHEGYTLWNSAEADKTWGRPWNALTGTPKRDLLGDLTNAVKASGLKMGYYYSLYEWFNPLWIKDRKRYVDEHMMPQIKDLVTRYKPALIFSDGEWSMTDSEWKSQEFLAWLFNESPVKNEVVVNDRWGSNTRGKNTGATYTTSEYGSGMDANRVWEESQGIGHSYGYNRNEKLEDYKSERDLILMLADIVSRGGNLLLDIGPTADGRIPVIMQQRLAAIGNWLKVNGDAIYGTTAYKQPCQWSSGRPPEKTANKTFANYSVAKLIIPKPREAYIEFFFTQKDKDLYCILPNYRSTFTIENLNVPAGTVATVLAGNKTVTVSNKGKDCLVDLSALKPGEIPAELVVVKLKGVL